MCALVHASQFSLCLLSINRFMFIGLCHFASYLVSMHFLIVIMIKPAMLLSPAAPKKMKGDYKIVSVRPSVCASVRPCIRPSTRISQKLLGQFQKLKFIWRILMSTCDLLCLYAHWSLNGLAMGQKWPKKFEIISLGLCRMCISEITGLISTNKFIWRIWMFSCALACSYAHWPIYGLPLGQKRSEISSLRTQNAYLRNYWVNFHQLKFIWSVWMSSCALTCLYAHWPINGLPMGKNDPHLSVSAYLRN